MKSKVTKAASAKQIKRDTDPTLIDGLLLVRAAVNFLGSAGLGDMGNQDGQPDRVYAVRRIGGGPCVSHRGCLVPRAVSVPSLKPAHEPAGRSTSISEEIKRSPPVKEVHFIIA
jgi:hypothetical protein